MAYLTDFRNYWKNLGENIEGINSVEFVSSYEEIMELQLSNANYPALVIETPDLDLKSLGGSQIGFDSAFAVIKGIPKDSTRTEISNLQDEMAEIAIKVWQKVGCDSDADDIINADLDSTLNPIIKATADNCYGWRGYFKISNIN